MRISDRLGWLYHEKAFAREDEGADPSFYASPRLVSHLDAVALATVESLIGALAVEPRPAILDLMASWDSHLPARLETSRVVGLGLNPVELEQNPRLDERVLHDLNVDPTLPFADASFDLVLNTVSVDYLTRPFEVFREAGRVLRPGGLLLVIFSNRLFPEKAVRIWRETPESQRVHLVEDFFAEAGCFERPRCFLSRGQPRPAQDRYAGLGLPSDPVWAVYANRLGAARVRPDPEALLPPAEEPALVEARRARLPETLCCPHCGERLLKWAVPQTPFTEWDAEHLYLCFNDLCPYLVRGFTVMAAQGNASFSYRLGYDRERDRVSAIPVYSLRQLRDGIVEEH